MKDRVMPYKLQIITMTKVFNKLNPDAEPDEIDWDSLQPDTPFEDNRYNMKVGNPQFKWTLLEDDSTGQYYEKCKYDDEQNEHTRLQNLGYSDDEIEEHLREYMRERWSESESFTKKFGTVWQKEETEDGTTHSATIEIKPHTTNTKGKRYTYGRIQLTVDLSLIHI